MNKTLAYLKEILKTTAKVTLIAGGTYFFAAPFALGLTATLLNAMTAGEIAAGVVTCLGGYAAIKTAVKDVLTMRERVEKKQREEHVDKELGELKEGLKKITPKKTEKTNGKQIQHETTQEQEPPQKKKRKWRKINPLFWRRTKKEYDRAA